MTFQTFIAGWLLACSVLFSAASFGVTPMYGSDPDEKPPAPIDVWPKLAPGETTSETGTSTDENGITIMSGVSRPQLFLYKAMGRGRHPAVLICPGGGYSILATGHEGIEPAHWLNSIGVTAAVLHYRVPGNREASFQDIQRAMSLLRSRSKRYGIDPNHLGVLGFSAGGHLAARLACGYSEISYPHIDKADRESCRPDFVLLIYPAYLADKTSGVCAPEVQPHQGMPPTFVTQTRDDPYFDADDYAKALESAGIPVEAAIFDVGGHGYGLRLQADQPAYEWPERAAEWIKAQMESPASPIHR